LQVFLDKLLEIISNMECLIENRIRLCYKTYPKTAKFQILQKSDTLVLQNVSKMSLVEAKAFTRAHAFYDFQILLYNIRGKDKQFNCGGCNEYYYRMRCAG